MRVFVIAIILLIRLLRCPAELHAQSPGPAVAPSRIFFVADRSESMLEISPPETTLVVINHVLDLAALAQQPIEVCVITYSGEGVHVFGQDGKPTAAYETLRAELLQKWPKPVVALRWMKRFKRCSSF